MAKAIKRRRGTTEEHKTFTGLDGEITVDTTKKTLVLHDQETAGGFPLASEAMLNEAVEKIEEEAEQTFVNKSGNEIIGGIKSFTGIIKSEQNGSVSTSISLENIRTGETRDIVANTDEAKRVGLIRITNANDGNQISIASFKKDGTFGGIISIKTNSENEYISSSPTPPILDNSTQIATTNWVRIAFPDWLSLNPATSINADDQAAIHNGIYRGKNLTSVYTPEQLSAKLQAGDFTDLYIGDYITKPFTYGGTTINVNWRFGHFNYWKYMGDTSCTENHILMVPDRSLFDSKMQNSNTTAGGVPATIVWQALQNAAYTAVNAANCMNGHVLQHRDWIPDSVNANAASASGVAFMGSSVQPSGWSNVKLGMLKEPMVYGCMPFSSSGYDVGCGKTQIALFKVDPTWICGRLRYNWWLGTVSSTTNFSYVDTTGYVRPHGASLNFGVRPYFLFA